VSAGTHPKPNIHPEAIGVLERRHVPAKGLVPKDLSQFVGQKFDFVITVCDRALEQCPVFPGADMIHWSFPDPAEADAGHQRRAFEETFSGLTQRIRLLLVVNERK
jgi:arsenate reductase